MNQVLRLNRWFPFWVLGLFPVIGFTQNRVLNPSFEYVLECPESFIRTPEQFALKAWKSATKATPDHYHFCSRKCGVPENWVGHCPAYEGKAYAGLMTYKKATLRTRPNYREYLLSTLKYPLERDSLYCVSIQVSLASEAQYGTNGIGIALGKGRDFFPTDGPLRLPTIFPLNYKPIQTEKGEWAQLQYPYEAKGYEQMIVIGNFLSDESLRLYHQDSLQQTPHNHNDFAYYYLDDIRIVPIGDSLSCPIEIPTHEEDDEITLSKGESFHLSSILFETDKDILQPISIEILDSLCQVFLDYPNLELEIIGHTDSQGGMDHNLDLSSRRAKAVADYFSKKGILRSKLTTKGLGPNQPISDNNSEKGRQLNRRVEFVIRNL